jgi:hypothetical protein
VAVTSGTFRTAEEIHRFLRATVHRIEHLQLLDAEVVVGAHFGEDSSTGLAVVSRPGLLKCTLARRQQHVDRVLR